ncbi:ribonuclease P protein component [Wolinella succinogenes]|uniref:ribonuclease P protein component n=1 Tax=Wolinella succinogenes TaxID=844 RepID=UPI0009D6F9D5|nr:ribonuclease P protein component [Wolinella succinogenes]NLU34470.1 ribonuclease P protein component [Wolinella succinogenes]HCZ19787.1 ribonuclease P protein component [Helicobacter sp.]
MKGLETLKRSREFDSAYSHGSKWHASAFVLFYRPFKEKKVGFTVSKKVGNAVKRNFAKRRLRALYQQYSSSLKEGVLVIVAKAPLLELEFDLLERDFIHAAKKLKILNEKV